MNFDHILYWYLLLYITLINIYLLILWYMSYYKRIFCWMLATLIKLFLFTAKCIFPWLSSLLLSLENFLLLIFPSIFFKLLKVDGIYEGEFLSIDFKGYKFLIFYFLLVSRLFSRSLPLKYASILEKSFILF